MEKGSILLLLKFQVLRKRVGLAKIRKITKGPPPEKKGP
jgi:hypothetical protein